jgi:hypothetical protein
MIDKVSGSAIRGIQRGLDGLRRGAYDIASQPVAPNRSSTDLARSLVELKQQETHTKANVEVLKAADDMVGTLLDVKA